MEHINIFLFSSKGMHVKKKKLNSRDCKTKKLSGWSNEKCTLVRHTASADVRMKAQRKHSTNVGQTCMSEAALNVCRVQSRHRDPKAGQKSPVWWKWLLLGLFAWNVDSTNTLTVWSQSKVRRKKQSHIYNPSLISASLRRGQWWQGEACSVCATPH